MNFLILGVGRYAANLLRLGDAVSAVNPEPRAKARAAQFGIGVVQPKLNGVAKRLEPQRGLHFTLADVIALPERDLHLAAINAGHATPDHFSE